MTKLTIDIPDELHRAVKSFTSMQGKTIKEFFIESATENLRKHSLMQAPKVSKKAKKSSKYMTEEEADKMLKPYLLRLIKRIESGEEELYSWEEVKKELDEA